MIADTRSFLSCSIFSLRSLNITSVTSAGATIYFSTMTFSVSKCFSTAFTGSGAKATGLNNKPAILFSCSSISLDYLFYYLARNSMADLSVSNEYYMLKRLFKSNGKSKFILVSSLVFISVLVLLKRSASSSLWSSWNDSYIFLNNFIFIYQFAIKMKLIYVIHRVS